MLVVESEDERVKREEREKKNGPKFRLLEYHVLKVPAPNLLSNSEHPFRSP